jgi:hypothetical protein
VDESNLLNPVGRLEVFLKSVDQNVGQAQKNGPQTESQNRVSNC